MNRPTNTGLEYPRLAGWVTESEKNREEVIDIVHRRSIPEGGCAGGKPYARAWLDQAFLLPDSTKEKMGLFNRAKIWDPYERERLMEQLGSALRDRLMADLKREEKEGYRIKVHIEGILSRYNRCMAHPRLEIPSDLRSVVGVESAVRIAETYRHTLLMSIDYEDEVFTEELNKNDPLGRVGEFVGEVRKKVNISQYHPLKLEVS